MPGFHISPAIPTKLLSPTSSPQACKCPPPQTSLKCVGVKEFPFSTNTRGPYFVMGIPEGGLLVSNPQEGGFVAFFARSAIAQVCNSAGSCCRLIWFFHFPVSLLYFRSGKSQRISRQNTKIIPNVSRKRALITCRKLGPEFGAVHSSICSRLIRTWWRFGRRCRN